MEWVCSTGCFSKVLGRGGGVFKRLSVAPSCKKHEWLLESEGGVFGMRVAERGCEVGCIKGMCGACTPKHSNVIRLKDARYVRLCVCVGT